MPAARTRLQWGGYALAGLLLTSLIVDTGCSPDGAAVNHHQRGLTHPGPWVIPSETLTIGDAQDVAYTGAGSWPGNCAPGITDGARQLKAYLLQAFPQQISSIGDFSCRAINGDSSKMSVHGTGRALDLMIPTIGSDADNDKGDPVGHWLIENAEAIGIQYIIWDLWTWRADRPDGDKDRAYGGAHNHKNHLHIELSVEGGKARTPFFVDAGAVTPPDGMPECEALGIDGGVIDDESPCFVPHGDGKYWRSVDGQGHGGSLLWTNAYDASEPGNWARWNIELTRSGEYVVEYHAEPDYAVHRETRYEIRHEDGTREVIVDQSKATRGWNELATVRFAAGSGQHVSVYDNYPGLTAADQHIVVDAIRLRRVEAAATPSPAPAPVEQPPTAEDPELDRSSPGAEGQRVDGLGGRTFGGCQLGSGDGAASGDALALLLGLAAITRRRRR